MEKVIQQLNEFLDGDDNSEYFCYQEEFDNPKPTDTELRLSINGRFNFTLMFPDMLFHSDEPEIADWAQKLNDFAEKEKDIVKILKYATSAYAALGIEDPDEDDDDDDLGNEELFVPVAEQPRVSNEEYEQANEFEKFRQQYEARGLVTNAQAASRIFSDLRQLWKTGKDFGFHAEPFKDNLYKWNVTFFNFEKDTELYKDVGEYKRKTGRDTLDFIMDFPPEYPFKPPFIRRIDFSDNRDYSDAEAKAAFARVAQYHGWEPK